VEEVVVTVCIAVSRAQIVGKMIQEQRERVRERWREGKTVNARIILGKTRGSDK
jgi:hypothetical protein